MTDTRESLVAPLLDARGITKRFGGVRALVGVDLELHRGEIVSLVGENGSGKSTLAKIIAGAIPPDGGDLALDGQPVSFHRPRDGLDAGVALVAQELTAVPHMSIAENVLLTRLHRVSARVRRRDLVEQSALLLRKVGLDVDPRRSFSSLGQGDRELAEVAKALASSPRLLILDEATTRLPDPERLFTLVEQIADEGVAILFITHRLREIRRLAHRAVVLRDGELVGGLTADELTDERISSMMVGRELTERFQKHRRSPSGVALRIDRLLVDGASAPASFSVRHGEVVGLAGLVGSGRSELLETITGIRPRHRGGVFVEGQPVTAGSTMATKRAGLSLVPEDRQEQGLVLGASVRANIAMASIRALARADRARECRIAREAVERFRIQCPDIESEVRDLSGGNQQKVVIARCLSVSPKVLLLDEPTRGVDIGAREEIYDFIGEMVERELAVLLASSDLQEILGLCDRILVLHEGAIVAELDREDATEERIAFLSAGGTNGEHAV